VSNRRYPSGLLMTINTVLGSGDLSSSLSFRGYEIDIEAGREHRTHSLRKPTKCLSKEKRPKFSC